MSYFIPVREAGMRKRVHAVAWYILEKQRDYPVETVCGRSIARNKVVTAPEVTCKSCLRDLKARGT
jgi:hypothetical protein